MKTRFNSFAYSVLFALLFSAGTGRAQVKVEFERLNSELMGIITNKSASDEDLLQAISRLGKVMEPPSFWNRIADDPGFSRLHRKRAVFALFRRHCLNGATLSELRLVVGQSKWIRESGISKVDYVIGLAPITAEPGQTVFQIFVFFGEPIYISVMGEVDTFAFSDYLRKGGTNPSEPVPSASNPLIMQFAYGDDYNNWFFNKSGNDRSRKSAEAIPAETPPTKR